MWPEAPGDGSATTATDPTSIAWKATCASRSDRWLRQLGGTKVALGSSGQLLSRGSRSVMGGSGRRCSGVRRRSSTRWSVAGCPRYRRPSALPSGAPRHHPQLGGDGRGGPYRGTGHPQLAVRGTPRRAGNRHPRAARASNGPGGTVAALMSGRPRASRLPNFPFGRKGAAAAVAALGCCSSSEAGGRDTAAWRASGASERHMRRAVSVMLAMRTVLPTSLSSRSLSACHSRTQRAPA
jgi:hypothetical protein